MGVNELSLDDIVERVLVRKTWFLVALVACLTITVLYGLVAGSKFTASASVINNEIETSNELISFQSTVLGFGGFKSDQVGPFDIFLYTLHSNDLFEKLINDDRNLVQAVLGLSEEEIEKGGIAIPLWSPNRYVNIVYGLPTYLPLTGEVVREQLNDRIRVSARDDVYTVAFSDRSRENAVEILKRLLDYSDELVKSSYLNAIEAKTLFISDSLSDSNLPADVQIALARRQERLLAHYVALKSEGSYSYQTLDRVWAPTIPSPPPIILVFIGLLCVAIMSIVWLSIFSAASSKSKNSRPQ